MCLLYLHYVWTQYSNLTMDFYYISIRIYFVCLLIRLMYVPSNLDHLDKTCLVKHRAFLDVSTIDEWKK